jgi:hypothetical protein
VRKVDVAVVAVIVAATATAMVVLPDLGDDRPEVATPSGEVVEIHARPERVPSGRDAHVAMNPDEPLVCMMDLDCVLHEVEVAAAIVPVVEPTSSP